MYLSSRRVFCIQKEDGQPGSDPDPILDTCDASNAMDFIWISTRQRDDVRIVNIPDIVLDYKIYKI